MHAWAKRMGWEDPDKAPKELREMREVLAECLGLDGPRETPKAPGLSWDELAVGSVTYSYDRASAAMPPDVPAVPQPPPSADE